MNTKAEHIYHAWRRVPQRDEYRCPCSHGLVDGASFLGHCFNDRRDNNGVLQCIVYHGKDELLVHMWKHHGIAPDAVRF